MIGMTRFSNIVEFFPIYCEIPHMNKMVIMTLIVSELKEVLQSTYTTNFKNNLI